MTTATAWLVLAGLWLGCLLPGPWPAALAGVTLLALGTRLRQVMVRSAVTAVAMLALGSGLAGGRIQLGQSGPLALLAERGGSASVTATVATEAHPSQDGAWLLVRTSSIDGAASGQRGLLRVESLSEAPPLGAGIAFSATARPLDNEGFDAHLRRLHAVASIRPVTPVAVISAPPALVHGTTAARVRVRGAAAARLPPDHAALLSGLVTGDTLGVSDAAREDLVAAGLSHLVAVSGSNVALVLGGTLAVASACGLGAKGRRRTCIVALIWFAVLVRAEPSVLRASVMALLVIGTQAAGRGRDVRHTLAVAASLLLLVDPLLAGQLGFALSVLATAGVLLVGPLVANGLRGPRPLTGLVAATVGAQLGVAPVLLAMEGGVPLGALPANLVAVPAAAVASAVGVAAGLVAQVSQGVGGVVAALAWPALSVVLWAGRTFADGPALQWTSFASPIAVAIGAAVTLRRVAPRAATVALAAVIVLAVAASLRGPLPVTALSLTALDVGQGDAMLVEVPARAGGVPARMLVDGGPDQTDALRLLRARGVSRLDAVVVSHPHADHSDGLLPILARMPAGALFVGPRAPGELEGAAASATAVEALAGERGIPVHRLAAGDRFGLGAAVVEVLGPPADGSLGREPGDNSLVMRVVSGDGAVLLTGDAEEGAQTRLLARPDLLRADVLKVPHHGGNTNAPGFIAAVGADTAVIGVGADNTFGHPHANVLADLGAATVLRTDTAGTVTATAAGTATATR